MVKHPFNLDQVSSHLGNLVERERAMTRLLNNGPEEHLDLVEKMQKGLKVALNIMLNGATPFTG